jgi:hypothetical protein
MRAVRHTDFTHNFVNPRLTANSQPQGSPPPCYLIDQKGKIVPPQGRERGGLGAGEPARMGVTSGSKIGAVAAVSDVAYLCSLKETLARQIVQLTGKIIYVCAAR